jgi:hypothetical protein
VTLVKSQEEKQAGESMTENLKEPSWLKKSGGYRGLRRVVGILAAFAAVLFIASFFLDEPLRSQMEKNINRDLKGYSVQLPKLHFRLLDLSLTLKEMTVLQLAHPDTPVVYFPVINASIHWREILSGKLVAEFRLDQPKININLLQLHSETTSAVPLKERGWQQALEDIYPLKINSLKINNAIITYIDKDPKKPLVLSNLNLQATNIRNINLPDQVYPSTFHLDTAIFGTGHGTVDGNANFLREPYPGIKGRLTLKRVPLDYFNTVSALSSFSIQGGLLDASGKAEYSPTVKIAQLENLDIQGMKIDYIHSKRTAAVEKKRAAAVGKAARKLGNKPGLVIRADQVSLTGCTLGFVNKAAAKPYRLFLSDTDFHLSNFSNQFALGPAQARLKAKFMGSGITTATGNFRPEKSGPDFDLHVKIEDTELTAMNNLLRAYGDFDVSAGIFSLVTELHVKNGTISGYIKPFFKDITVYDRRSDKDQGIFHEMYEMMVGGAAGLLENRSQQEVATRAKISGSLGNPETSTWEIIGGLIKNAFFKAILHRFEKKAGSAEKS